MNKMLKDERALGTITCATVATECAIVWITMLALGLIAGITTATECAIVWITTLLQQ
jgi:hypothetical protein